MIFAARRRYGRGRPAKLRDFFVPGRIQRIRVIVYCQSTLDLFVFDGKVRRGARFGQVAGRTATRGGRQGFNGGAEEGRGPEALAPLELPEGQRAVPGHVTAKASRQAFGREEGVGQVEVAQVAADFPPRHRRFDQFGRGKGVLPHGHGRRAIPAEVRRSALKRKRFCRPAPKWQEEKASQAPRDHNEQPNPPIGPHCRLRPPFCVSHHV